MKSVDREGLSHGTLVSYAIAMALFDELVGPDKMRVAQKLLVICRRVRPRAKARLWT